MTDKNKGKGWRAPCRNACGSEVEVIKPRPAEKSGERECVQCQARRARELRKNNPAAGLKETTILDFVRAAMAKAPAPVWPSEAVRVGPSEVVRFSRGTLIALEAAGHAARWTGDSRGRRRAAWVLATEAEGEELVSVTITGGQRAWVLELLAGLGGDPRADGLAEALRR